MARPARRRPGTFGPPWLKARLAQLLPQFPRVRVCVAFSGGADSTALLGALAALARPPLAVRALYVDHALQPASASWGRQCRGVAQSLAVPYAVRRARIVRARGESLEAAARTARYQLFAESLREGEVLLTAHHQDDQCETLLLQLLRGAGLSGLAAMPVCAPLGRGLLVRPLLEVPRGELRAWVKAQRLTWVEDDSNAQLHLDRNYLRARVLPPLIERWPAAAATVARAARHIGEAQQLLEALAAEDLRRARHGGQLAASALRALPGPRRRNALRAWLGALGARTPSTSVLAQMAGALLAARADAQPRVAWGGAYVERCADLLSLHLAPAGPVPRAPGSGAPPTTSAAGPPISWRWRAARRCALPAGAGTLRLQREVHGPLDLDALGATLQLRVRSGGERLRPVRGGPRRSLKQLLQEAHVPLALRAQLPLLFDGERLIAAGDLWLDESVQARADSAHRGRLVWQRGG
jgi:tRNA(Ile)-lysidine synthase